MLPVTSSRYITTTDHVIQGPAADPIGLEDIKLVVRLVSSNTLEDPLLTIWAKAVVDYVQRQSGRQIMTAVLSRWLDAFPCRRRICIPNAPLQSVSSVTYYDGSGVQHSLVEGTDYRVTAPQGPYAELGEIEAVTTWPGTDCRRDAVQIEYLAGYSSFADQAPPLMKAALWLLASHLWSNREQVLPILGGQFASLPLGAEAFIAAFQVPMMNPYAERNPY